MHEWEVSDEQLSRMLATGFVVRDDDGGYTMTDEGAKFTKDFLSRLADKLEEAEDA